MQVEFFKTDKEEKKKRLEIAMFFFHNSQLFNLFPISFVSFLQLFLFGFPNHLIKKIERKWHERECVERPVYIYFFFFFCYLK